MEGMADAYLSWFSSLGDAGLANNNPTPSSHELQGEYTVEVLDTFGKRFSNWMYSFINLFY